MKIECTAQELKELMNNTIPDVRTTSIVQKLTESGFYERFCPSNSSKEASTRACKS